MMLKSIITKYNQSTFKYQVVFLRHGQSLWNKQNRFTGWTDIKLSANGIQEAIKAGKALRQNGFQFDICFTSVLTRAIQTMNHAFNQLDCHYIPVVKSWRLNQRHYGALQGLNKLQTVEKHGKEQVMIWRRSFDIPPPPLDLDDQRHPKNDKRYADLKEQELPLTEMTIERVMPFWYENIVPCVKSGKKVLVVAHGNSMRALVKKLSGVSDKQITQLNIPTGIPLVYQFDEEMKTTKDFYLADDQELMEKVNKVKQQTEK